MKITDNFTREEFEKSDTADSMGIDNHIRDAVVFRNVTELCKKILQPLRIAYGKPIRISSGYRCEALNKAVGGVATSQHLFGMAADIQGTSNAENSKLMVMIQTMRLPFDQLILEKCDRNGDPKWIHISYSWRNRRQILRC